MTFHRGINIQRGISLVMLVVFLPAFAIGEGHNQAYRLNTGFLKDLTGDFGAVISAPTHWRGKNLLTLSAIVGAGALVYLGDDDLQKWVIENRAETVTDASNAVSFMGQGTFITALSAAMYLTGEIRKDRDLRKTALLSLESWLTSGAIVLGLKYVIGRARPAAGEGKDAFKPFSSSSRYYSFPSGHASSAFAVAAVVASQSDSSLIDMLSYGLASMVALSRIGADKHWGSDVLIGSAIGYFVGHKIADLHDDKTGPGLALGFRIHGDQRAVSLTWTF